MVQISAAQVKELREATNVSMMECKKALMEAHGDLALATKLLRERGMAVAAKKASRAANQGIVASAGADDGNTRSLVEVNCETDFVARNENFIAFVKQLADQACRTDDTLAETMNDALTAKVAEIGENIVVRRNTRYVRQGHGAVAAYIHLNGKVGVLVELACGKPETAGADAFGELARDLTLQVAASAPAYLAPGDVTPDVIAAERDIYAKQVQDKPAPVVDKIVNGKLQKFFSETCLLNQGFVREPKLTIAKLLDQKGKELGDALTVKRFTRYQLGR